MKKILMVDDDVRLLCLLKKMLDAKATYEVRTEDSAIRAISLAREWLPDLIILDVTMPEMAGGDVAAEMREDERLRHVPVIFLTSLVTEREVRQRRGKIGGERYLAKPIDPEVLCREVGALLPA
jgi:CheY-like chemotaxis protein